MGHLCIHKKIKLTEDSFITMMEYAKKSQEVLVQEAEAFSKNAAPEVETSMDGMPAQSSTGGSAEETSAERTSKSEKAGDHRRPMC